MHGDVFKIARLRMASDGTGVSTLVAFWGCPLQCRYCINDQCHDKKGQMKGIERGAYTPEELVEVLRKDDIYYRMTGGGIVFGGGEPLQQAEFIHEVCRITDPSWVKRIETSLYGDWRQFRCLVDDIDEWIIDIKDMNGEIYRKYTGMSNDSVKRNLRMLKKRVPAKRVRIRVPLIPGYNNEEDVMQSKQVLWNMGFSNIDEFVYQYSHFVKVEKKVTESGDGLMGYVIDKDKNLGIRNNQVEIPDFFRTRYDP